MCVYIYVYLYSSYRFSIILLDGSHFSDNGIYCSIGNNNKITIAYWSPETSRSIDNRKFPVTVMSHALKSLNVKVSMYPFMPTVAFNPSESIVLREHYRL